MPCLFFMAKIRNMGVTLVNNIIKLTEISAGGHTVEYWAEDDGQGNVRKLERITPKYNGASGKCKTYFMPELVTAEARAEAIVKGQLKRKAIAQLSGKGNRTQKHHVVMATYAKLEQCDDNGR